MAFKFPLDTLLNHRRHLEDSVVPELHAAQEALSTEEMIRERLLSLAAWGESELAKHQVEGRAGWELAIFHDFLNRVRGERIRSEERLESLRSRVDLIRADLLEKRKGRRVVEILKEKSWHNYRREEDRKEQRVLDEVAQLQFKRTQGDGHGR
jgi:flagellar FliJ protein